jgi:Zn-dependent peptidase ImmA (M78 family)/predicted secreted protein
VARSRGIDQLQAQASMEATRLHRRLGTTFDGPVDVLGIATSLDLILMVQPLDNLLGFYVRGADRSGIVINSQRPESLQRFTLAHEIGHHVLGHELSADDEHSVERFDPNSPLEAAAQAFAASLLMPQPLINRALRELPGIRHARRLTPADAYLFSRQLGVSYEAGLWTLYRNQRLPITDVHEFRKSSALAAKNSLRGRDHAGDARADVWALTADNNELSVVCRIGDEIHVQLPEDTSTGLAWLVREPAAGGLFDSAATAGLSWSDDDISATDTPLASEGFLAGTSGDFDDAVEIVHDEHVRPQPAPGPAGEHHTDLFTDAASEPLVTTGGVRSLTFVPRGEGHSRVLLELAQPWDADSPARDRYRLDLRVRPKTLAEQGLIAPRPDTWIDEHAVSG